jgi:hypothetical protein
VFDLKLAFRTIWRILTFRATPEEIEDNWAALILVGLALTWVVGIGRWWDDPRDIPTFARYGVGSLLYVFGLSTLLWILTAPVTEPRTNWFHVICFVAATSVPGIVYAVPIELIAPDSAPTYNVIALSFVSSYRVSLLVWFLLKICGLRVVEAVIVAVLPISVIAGTLVAMGMGGHVLDIMGGLRERIEPTAVEQVISTIGGISCCLGPISLLLYLFMIFNRRFIVDDEP